MSDPDSTRTGQLIQRTRQGEPAVLGQLLERHRPFLEHVVAARLDRRLRARLDPSDIVQETQLEAARRFERYVEQPGMPFRLWLRQLAYDRLLMARRRHLGASRRAAGRELALPESSSARLAEQLLEPGPSPSQQFDQQELAQRVRRAISRMPETDREMLVMRNFEGLSNREVACLLHIDPASASKRYGRALLRLRSALIDEGLGK